VRLASCEEVENLLCSAGKPGWGGGYETLRGLTMWQAAWFPAAAPCA
jgi:hypothetical protein